MGPCAYELVLEDLTGCGKKAASCTHFAMLFFAPPSKTKCLPHGKLLGMYFYSKVLDMFL